MHSKGKIPLHFNQNVVYKCSNPDESCSQSYIGESSRCTENTEKEHSSHITSAIYIHSESNNHPCAKISHLKVKAQDSKQVAREAIYIRINHLVLNHNTGKMYIPEIFNSLLGAERLLIGQSKWQTQTFHKVIHI